MFLVYNILLKNINWIFRIFKLKYFKLKVGCDYSDQLIKICSEKSFNCFVSDCLKIPCKNDYLDYVICIAVLHHLSTQVN